MSQTAITYAFEQWKAQQAADGQPVMLDEFVLADVPDLDVTAPVDRAEGLPDARYIVHRQAVSMTGVVNENAVVYSVTMGADVGDFAFNWVGLINKATGTLAMVVHAPSQSKVRNSAGQQGNVLTRSFLMEYNGAATETQITTPAETWQIDFTARLGGIDERQRVASQDVYGAGAFFGDGYLVTRSGNDYSVAAGVGYVGGLRVVQPNAVKVTVTVKPVKVWVDACWKGTLTGVWVVDAVLKVAASLDNYVKDGQQHYVFAVASIDANGVITDLRPKGSLSDQTGSQQYLRKDKNLSDVTNASEARKSLGLKGAALLDVGKAANTVAAGDDSRIVNALQKSGGIITANGQALAIKPVTTDASCYVRALKSDNSNHWYIGQGSDKSNGVAWHNYLNSSTITLNYKQIDLGAETVYSNGAFKSDSNFSGRYQDVGSFAQQYNTAAVFYEDFSTTGTSEYHPLIKQRARTSSNSWAFSQGVLISGTDLTWRLQMKRSSGEDVQFIFDTGGSLKVPGSISAENLYAGSSRMAPDGNIWGAKWDNKWLDTYLRDTFYSKKESDNKYALKNTSSSVMFKDTSTGKIFQWGTVNRTADTMTVTFPTRFPNACRNVQLTLGSSYYGSESKSNFSANSLTAANFRLVVYYQEPVVHWFAIGD